MVGKLIEWISEPIEGPLTNAINATMRLVYQRGLLDGFLVGVVLTLMVTMRSRRCEK